MELSNPVQIYGNFSIFFRASEGIFVHSFIFNPRMISWVYLGQVNCLNCVDSCMSIGRCIKTWYVTSNKFSFFYRPVEEIVHLSKEIFLDLVLHEAFLYCQCSQSGLSPPCSLWWQGHALLGSRLFASLSIIRKSLHWTIWEEDALLRATFQTFTLRILEKRQ